MPATASGEKALSGGAYQEYAPPLSLGSLVECFWTRGASPPAGDGARFHRVVPDGCVDVIVCIGDACPADVQALAVGAMTRPVVFTDSPGTEYVAVRFKPGVAAIAFGVPAIELTDQRVALADLWDGVGTLTDALRGAECTRARTRIFGAAIAGRLRTSVPPPLVSEARDRIYRSRGRLSIAALGRDLGVSRQHLARAFAENVGLSPKRLARIVRASAVVERLRQRASPDYGELAHAAGYYDQSHLIAEIRELTGLAPSDWALARR